MPQRPRTRILLPEPRLADPRLADPIVYSSSLDEVCYRTSLTRLGLPLAQVVQGDPAPGAPQPLRPLRLHEEALRGAEGAQAQHRGQQRPPRQYAAPALFHHLLAISRHPRPPRPASPPSHALSIRSAGPSLVAHKPLLPPLCMNTFCTRDSSTPPLTPLPLPPPAYPRPALCVQCSA